MGAFSFDDLEETTEITPPPMFTCPSCDVDKHLSDARDIDGTLWCTECAGRADEVDAWVAETEPTRTISDALLGALLKSMELEVR